MIIAKLWKIQEVYIIPTVVRALEIVTKKLDEWLEKLGIKVKVEIKGPLMFGYDSLP